MDGFVQNNAPYGVEELRDGEDARVKKEENDIKEEQLALVTTHKWTEEEPRHDQERCSVCYDLWNHMHASDSDELKSLHAIKVKPP